MVKRLLQYWLQRKQKSLEDTLQLTQLPNDDLPKDLCIFNQLTLNHFLSGDLLNIQNMLSDKRRRRFNLWAHMHYHRSLVHESHYDNPYLGDSIGSFISEP